MVNNSQRHVYKGTLPRECVVICQKSSLLSGNCLSDIYIAIYHTSGISAHKAPSATSVDYIALPDYNSREIVAGFYLIFF